MCRCVAAIARAVVAFLDAVLVSCFLSCFRPRPRPGSGSSCRGLLVPRDQEAEALRDDEQGLWRTGRLCEGLPADDGIDEDELRHEANYLKLCGAISETPAELQNEFREISLENTDKCNNMPISEPATITLQFEANSSEDCSGEKHYIRSPELIIEDSQYLSGVESAPRSAFLEKTPLLNSKQNLLDSSCSPFPTPSILGDDMETPGTIYTTQRGAPVSGKRVRARKQFIYPVLRPIENKHHHTELTNDPKGRNLGADSIKKCKQKSSSSVAKPGSSPHDNASHRKKEAQSKCCQIDNIELDGELPKSNSDEKHAASSLSHWLRPSMDVEDQGDVKCAVGDESYDECNLLTARPVFVASNLNWDTEEPTPRFSKIWNGNGIPNTTTRYKEDQKVTWHATPFEERLLKVLSDEDVRPARVARGNLFHPEEIAE
ncbi:hypothetical protein EJB05_41911, partial [Eragrostis curvula]